MYAFATDTGHGVPGAVVRLRAGVAQSPIKVLADIDLMAFAVAPPRRDDDLLRVGE